MRTLSILTALVLSLATFTADNFAAVTEVQSQHAQFAKPDAANKPWVFWFWNNGNITAEGITADLEAMARTGIGGVLIMEVGQGAPRGDVDFLSDDWRKFYTFMLSEATRLGIEVNMNNDAGWNGSGGKWIKPEHGMQILTWSETVIDKPTTNEITLPEPQKRNDYYRDIAIFAFPTPVDAVQKKNIDANSNRRATPNDKAIVNLNEIIDLTGKLKPNNTMFTQ
jgi:hypothetical protein